MTTARPSPGEPAELDALLARAVGHHRAGRLDEAATAYGEILTLRPDIAEVHCNLGVILKGQGRLDEAVARYQHAIALKPEFVEAYNNLGNALREQGKPDQAAARYRQAIALRPQYAEAHNNLGIILFHEDKLDQAVAQYEQALALKPDLAEAHNNLGNALKRQGKFDQAAARFEHAIALWPDYAEAHCNLGNVLLGQGKPDEATERYERALALRPDYAEALCNLGHALMQLGEHDRALARLEHALALDPDYADAHKNLGSTLLDQLKLPAAREAFGRLRALRPDSIDAHVGLATCYFLEGDYERAWPAYEGRMQMAKLGPLLDRPRWTGEPLAGRSLLLVTEQGLGDTLQFVRFARVLKEQGARVVLACPPAVGRLLASYPDLDELFVLGSAAELPLTDYYLPLLSVPGVLGTTVSSIPARVPYLLADAELIDRWRRELASVDGFKIGIVWQGARDYSSDRWRSIPLSQFAPLARLPGVRLISLQKGFGAEQIAAVGFPVLDLSDRLDVTAGPFMDTAAVIQNVDLVVTPDTAIGHLAGALGAPIWLALQFSPNWRWLLGRDDSPWYPIVRLFRQTDSGGWPDVFERIANAVQACRAEIG
ncbi:MAG TPA: tetratricopeptide repeat protein [Pirellulales bacterium]|jgi:tetratricopeptide (TPR) repeat protein|nr:tetratricopeptide repeat protein [Pirellulales bacterium]